MQQPWKDSGLPHLCEGLGADWGIMRVQGAVKRLPEPTLGNFAFSYDILGQIPPRHGRRGETTKDWGKKLCFCSFLCNTS